MMKLNNISKPLLGIAGQHQNGKSTFLNCLLDGHYAVEGDGLATTKYNAKYVFGDFFEIKAYSANQSVDVIKQFCFSAQETLCKQQNCSFFQISSYSPILQTMDLLDSPGYGASGEDDTSAYKVADISDFIILVVSKTLNEECDIPFLTDLVKKNKHFSVILNCMEKMDPRSKHVRNLCREIHSQLYNANLDSNHVQLTEEYPVYPVNLLWAQCALGYLTPEETSEKLESVKFYSKMENLTSHALLHASNFLPIRGILENIVTTFFNFTPSHKLDLMKSVSDNWTNELKNILEDS